MNEIIGYQYCKYGSVDYDKNHHIFNVGDYAIITGNGGVHSSSIDYFKRLSLGRCIKKAYLNCKEHPSNLPNNYFIIGKKVEILNREYWGNCGTKICLIEVNGWQFIIGMDYLKPIKKGEYMNEIIVEMFPKTKEAILVDKWFGKEIDKSIFKMLIKGKEKELIAEATRLEQESKIKSN